MIIYIRLLKDIVSKLNQKIETKVSKEVKTFIREVRKLSPGKAQEIGKTWDDYYPELLKCESKDEVAMLLLAFFERGLKSVKDEAGGKEFYKLRYDTVGKMQNCLYTLGVNKNVMKDYTKHLHSIQGASLERGVMMADEKFERPDEMEKTGQMQWNQGRKPITTEELKKRHRGSHTSGGVGTYWEGVAAAGFAVSILVLFLWKLL